MPLIGNWHFTALDGAHERSGNFDDLVLEGFAGLSSRGLELGFGSWARATYTGSRVLREKTIVMWVRMTKVDDPRQGGSVMSVAQVNPNNEPFDGLAFGDTGDFAWLAASSWNQRTQADWASAGQEDAAGSWGKLVKMAVTYRDLGGGRAEMRIYRQPIGAGQRRGALELLQRFEQGQLVDFAGEGASQVLFGPRFFSNGQPVGHVTCTVAAAQVWDEALDETRLGKLRSPLVRTVDTGAGGENPEASETFALIVGVEDYLFLDDSADSPLGRSNLKGTLEDVRSYAMLTRLMGVPAANIRVLTGPKLGPNDFASMVMGREVPVDMNMVEASFGYATQEGILSGLAWLSAQLRTNPDSQGLVFFAGHSVTTTAGHLALAAMDTRRRSGSAPATVLDPGTDAAWLTWFTQAGLLRRLSGVLGTRDADAILAALEVCFAPGMVSPQSLAEAVHSQGCDLEDPFTRALLRDLVQMAGNQHLNDAFLRARQLGLSRAWVEAALGEDPLAQDDELDGLISFTHALGTALMPLPEDRAVTFVLETCLPEGPGRTIRDHYRTNGMPLAHGNVAALASCGLGDNSYAGVFDNRWHGAFTWALTSTLSQWDVVVSNAGRYFKPDYNRLLEVSGRLMRMMGFAEQEPAMWAQPWAREWPVFGRGEWKEQIEEVALLRRVKVKEQIDPGGSGHIWVIADNATGGLGSSNVLGYLVSVAGVNPNTTVDGLQLQVNRDYWLWKDAAFPTGDFFLRRPPTAPSPSEDTLQKWLELNVSGSFATKICYLQGQFQAPPGGPPAAPSGAGHVVKIGSSILAFMQKLGSNDLARTWRRTNNAPLNNQRVALMASGPIAPASGVVVEYLWQGGPPSVTWADAPVNDVPQT